MRASRKRKSLIAPAGWMRGCASPCADDTSACVKECTCCQVRPPSWVRSRAGQGVPAHVVCASANWVWPKRADSAHTIDDVDAGVAACAISTFGDEPDDGSAATPPPTAWPARTVLVPNGSRTMARAP